MHQFQLIDQTSGLLSIVPACYQPPPLVPEPIFVQLHIRLTAGFVCRAYMLSFPIYQGF